MAAGLLCQVVMQPIDAGTIVEEVLAWSVDALEQRHAVFGDMPICPFARAARLKQAIRFEVRAFSASDRLEPGNALLRLVSDFADEDAAGRHETLFVIHPRRDAMSAHALERFVARLERRLRAVPRLAGLRVFEAHPESAFQVGGVYTRRGPFPSFQVLSHARLKASSDSLQSTGYYDRFTPAMLRAVGMPR